MGQRSVYQTEFEKTFKYSKTHDTCIATGKIVRPRFLPLVKIIRAVFIVLEAAQVQGLDEGGWQKGCKWWKSRAKLSTGDYTQLR